MKTKEEVFETFMSQLLETNVDLPFYTDFEKCHANVEKIAIKLHTLNYLIGKENLQKAIHFLWEQDKRVFSVLDILIAVRNKDKKKVLTDNKELRLIESYFNSPDKVIEYVEKTGLADLFKTKKINNLVDYVFGIEVGLDTNARKNRGGHIMERMVADNLAKANIEFRQEVYSQEFEPVAQALGVDSKRFDFVIKTKEMTYLMEVNFYSSGGSKLNEVARSYSEIAPKINACEGYQFVWITDGIGWQSAKGKLQEAFDAIPHIYNLQSMSEFITLVQSQQVQTSNPLTKH